MDLRSQNKTELALALILTVFGVLFRLLPHPGNFTPTTAVALFAGAALPPAMAFTVPILVLAVSDLILGPHPLFPVVWACFILVTALGRSIGSRAGFTKSLLAAAAGSAVFFVLTNLAVFLFENMYPKTWEGFVQCFVMALPFWRQSLAGDLLYTLAFFSLFALSKAAVRARQAA